MEELLSLFLTEVDADVTRMEKMVDSTPWKIEAILPGEGRAVLICRLVA